MRILVLGSGGREHAIGLRLSQDSEPHALFFAPGNPGMTTLGQPLDIQLDDTEGLIRFAQREAIDLTIVGPEQPLADGLVDAFNNANLAIFGPTQACAQLESSKAFAKALMAKAQVPTAHYAVYPQPLDAMAYLESQPAPYVIKEDGLAAGKGVTIAFTLDEAKAALHAAEAKNMAVVMEGFLQGEELSVLAICDGQRAIPLVSAQDYKRIGDGQTGPNTGGMGALAPVPFVTPALMDRIQQQVLDPMMAALKAEKLDYRGVLYAGLMINHANTANETINVVEFNCRFGDPETQVVLPLLNEDLAPILTAAAKGDLSRWYASGFAVKANTTAIGVVLASGGYPGDYTKGHAITLPTLANAETRSASQSQWVIHAGTRRQPDGSTVTSGGRVLCAMGMGETIHLAREYAYNLADSIAFEGKTLRRDIGLPGANRAPSPTPAVPV